MFHTIFLLSTFVVSQTLCCTVFGVTEENTQQVNPSLPEDAEDATDKETGDSLANSVLSRIPAVTALLGIAGIALGKLYDAWQNRGQDVLNRREDTRAVNNTLGLQRTVEPDFQQALETRALENALLLLKAGANPSIKSEMGNTAFHVIASYKQLSDQESDLCIEIIEILKQSNVDINQTNTEDMTPLRQAIADNNRPIVKLLLDCGADVHTRSKNGSTPLHKAVAIGSMDIIKLLIEHGACVDAQNDTGKTPLIFAAGLQTPQVIEFLLENGSYINHADKDEKTPLRWAFHKERIDNAMTLVLHGAFIPEHRKKEIKKLFEKRYSAEQYTKLTVAALFGDQDLLQAQLNSELSKHTDAYGMTVLHRLISQNHHDLVCKLLENTSFHDSMDIPDVYGNTPLHCAVANRYVSLAQLLIAHGAQDTIRNHQGVTAADLMQLNPEVS
jgi:ankyrin repeat protein